MNNTTTFLAVGFLSLLPVIGLTQDFNGEENLIEQGLFERYRDIVFEEPDGPGAWDAVVGLQQLMDSSDINVVADSAEVLAWYGMRDEEVIQWVTAKANHGRRWDRLGAIYALGSFAEAGKPAIQEFWDGIEESVLTRRTGVHPERARALWSIVDRATALPDIQMNIDSDENFTLPAWMLFNLAQRGKTEKLREEYRNRLYTWAMDHDMVSNSLQNESIRAWFALMRATKEEPDFFAFLDLLNDQLHRHVWITIMNEVAAYDDAAGMFLPRINRLSKSSNSEVAVAATVARFRICGDQDSQTAILDLDQQAFNQYSSMITVRMLDLFGSNPMILELSLNLGDKMPSRTTSLLEGLVRKENSIDRINNPSTHIRLTIVSILENRGVTVEEISYAADLAYRWNMREAIPPLIKVALHHEDWKVRQLAMNFLSAFRGSESFDTMMMLRKDANPQIRQTALRLLVNFPEEKEALNSEMPISSAEASLFFQPETLQDPSQ